MPAHAHAQYQLTLYAGGPRRFNIAGRTFTGDTRTSVIIQSGEPHGSVAVEDEHTALRTFYIDEQMMEEAAASIWHRAGHGRASASRGSTDASTVAMLHGAHRSLEDGGLEGEVAFCTALEQLVRRHAAPTGAAREARAQRRPDGAGARSAGGPRRRQRPPRRAGAGRRREPVSPDPPLPAALRRHALCLSAQPARRAGPRRPAATANRSPTRPPDLGFADQSHLGRAFRA